MRRFRTDDGDQIVECGQYAYVWPKYYPPLQLGESVWVTENIQRMGTYAVVTALGTELGGAIGFVAARAGKTR